MKKLTHEYIEERATGPSLTRGRSYYVDGAIEKITMRGNVYEARVQGTRLYKVSVFETDKEYHFFCNCPYDFGGICKHCVAVGMAIVDGKFIVEEKALVEEEEASHISVEQFLEEVYSPSDPGKKEEFLKMLLEIDEELRAQFYSFVNETEDAESSLSIDEIRNKVYKIFSEFDFSDIDYDYYYSTRPQHGYVEEWEIHYDLAKEMIEHAFDGYACQAIAHVKKGNLVDGMKVVLGLYEGCQNIYLPENDPNCVFEDGYNDELMDQVTRVIDKTVETIHGTVKTTSVVKRSLELLIQRYHHYDQIDHSEGESEIGYNLNIFRDFILVLLINVEVAKFLDNLFEQYHVDDRSTAFVRLEIAKLTNDEARWLEEAEVFAAAEPEIARQLMDHYLKQEKRDEFYEVAKQAFQNWPSEFDEYLIVKVSKKEQKGFYTKVLAHVTERKEDIERYKELRGLFSEQEKNKFIERNTVNRIFYVKLLAVDERFGEILDYVEEHSDSFDFARLIRPILNVYPEECFNLIRGKTDETLKDQRGRTVYQRVVGWLLEMKKIEALTKDIEPYFEEIIHRKPILPALRDEMRKARLI